jgi:hypothetical protein
MSDVADEFDVGTDGEASASPDALVNLRESIQTMIDLEENIAIMEDDLKAAKHSLQSIRTGRLPDLMAEIQSDHFTHDGWECKLNDFVSGSLPKDPVRRAAAIDWLERNEAEGLIKTDVKVVFGRSQYDEAVEVADNLMQEGHAVDVSSGVHAQTLQAFARERIRNGDEIDCELLGLYSGKVVKATKVKTK